MADFSTLFKAILYSPHVRTLPSLLATGTIDAAQSEKCAVEITLSASSLCSSDSEVRTELQNFETLLDIQLNCNAM